MTSGLFFIILGIFLESLGNQKFYCLLLFFLSLPQIFNTINNFWIKETGRCKFCCFSSEMFVLIQIGIFFLKLGKKYMFCHWEYDPISAIKSTEKKPWTYMVMMGNYQLF
jgi:hypothetical protein